MPLRQPSPKNCTSLGKSFKKQQQAWVVKKPPLVRHNELSVGPKQLPLGTYSDALAPRRLRCSTAVSGFRALLSACLPPPSLPILNQAFAQTDHFVNAIAQARPPYAAYAAQTAHVPPAAVAAATTKIWAPSPACPQKQYCDSDSTRSQTQPLR